MSPNRPRPSHSARSWVRLVVEWHLLVLTAAVALRAFALQGVVVPLRVASNSMAPTFLGPHASLRCPTCRIELVCGFERLASGDALLCANCGQASPRTGPDEAWRIAPRPGERLLVDRSSLLWRNPRRWEVLVYRLPGPPSQLAIKRVAGLPGERVEIRGGDLFIDGELARKPLATFRAMAQLVHDDRFRPSPQDAASEAASDTASIVASSPRWLPEEEDGPWRADPRQSHYRLAGDSPAARQTNSAGEPAWITWRNVDTLGGLRLPPGTETTVDDRGGYHPPHTAAVHEVRDLLLSGWMLLGPQSRILWRGRDGDQVLEIEIDLSEGEIRVRQSGETVHRQPAPPRLTGRRVPFEAALCDQQVMLGLDGRELCRVPYVRADAGSGGTSRPWSIGAAGGEVEVGDLRVARDVFYLSPYGGTGGWEREEPLGSAEWFLLGDAPAVSQDSRFPTLRPVSRELLLGRVLRWPGIGNRGVSSR